MKKLIFASLMLLAFATGAMAAGFREGYTVASGDLDGDGLKDLFIKGPRKVVPIELDDLPVFVQAPAADVPDFVLLNTGSRTFTIAPALTGAQLATVRQWPVADGLDLWFRDVNQDGYVDMEIDGLTPLVPQAFDQIVYAPSTRGQIPSRLGAKDLKFQHYHEQVFGWMRDPYYFDNHAPLKIKSAEPATRYWYGSIADPGNVTLQFKWVSECQAAVGANGTCALSTATPPPPCDRNVTYYDSAGNPVGSGTDNICSKPVHVIIYLPGGIVFERDYSGYDNDARDTVDILIRLSTSCPAFNPQDEERLGTMEERIYQGVVLAGAAFADHMNSESHAPFPGDDLFDPSDKTFHHYDVRTKICSVTEPNCNMTTVRDIAHRSFSAPHIRLQPEYTAIPGPYVMAFIAPAGRSSHVSEYILEAGLVSQRMVASGPWSSSIQNVTQAGHISYPGTISRFVEQRGNDLNVFTHGIGVNRGRCALNQASRPLQILLATANDIEGPKQFNMLSKQMRIWWKKNYNPSAPPEYVPYDYSSGGTPPPAGINPKGTAPNY